MKYDIVSYPYNDAYPQQLLSIFPLQLVNLFPPPYLWLNGWFERVIAQSFPVEAHEPAVLPVNNE